MSEPDNEPRRRPPTIDLSATEVAPEQTAEVAPSETIAANADASASHSGSASTPASSPIPPPGRSGSYAIGGLGGAVLMLLILGGLWWAGVLAPPGTGEPAPVAANTSEPAIRELSTRLTKVEAAVAAPRNDSALVTRLAAAESETKSLSETIATLNRRLDTSEGTTRDARNRADEAAAAADAARRAAQSGVQRGDLDALTNRIAALERSAKAVSEELAKRAANGSDHAARLVVAAEALRAAVERGDPYASALAAVKALGSDQAAVSALEPFAATGVPKPAALARQLSAVMPAVRHAAGMKPSDAGILERLQANAQKLIRVTPLDAPAGDDASALIARIEFDADHADIDGVLAEIAKLPDEARAAAAQWVQRAQARNAALAAGRRIAGDALAALAKPATQ